MAFRAQCAFALGSAAPSGTPSDPLSGFTEKLKLLHDDKVAITEVLRKGA
jgi:hypothetical protein